MNRWIRAATLLLTIALAACGGRASLPSPRTPLVRTRDASFRRVPAPHRRGPVAVATPTTSVLANGIQVNVVAQRDLPLVAIAFASRNLGTDDAGSVPGLATFTALVLDRELSRMARIDPGHELPEPGVSISGDGLVVVTQVPTREVGRALSQLAASLRSESCYPADVELARISQRAMVASSQTVGAQAQMVLDEMLYSAADRRAMPRYGSPGSVEGFNAEHCAAERRRGLVPSASAIAIVGDVDATETMRLVEAALGPWTRPAAPASARTAPTFLPVNQNVAFIPIVTQQAAVMVVERGPGPREPGFAAFGVLARLLGGMFVARINEEVRERRGWSYGVSAARSVASDHSTLRVECAVDARVALPTLELIENELRRLGTPGAITQDELETAISMERAALLHRVESRGGLAISAAEAFLRGGQLADLAAHDAELARMTASDVTRQASALRAGSSPTVIVGPRELGFALQRARPGRAR